MRIKSAFSKLVICALLLWFAQCKEKVTSILPIDRHAVVIRHNVVLHQPDTLGSLSVGNGEFAFTVDVSGLQTFYKEYENGIPLGTQSQWGWHRMPQKEKYGLNDVAVEFESCDGTRVPYPVQHSIGKAGEVTKVLRANPHRLHLGMVGLILLKENGEEVKLDELTNINQQVNLWIGEIKSNYEVEGTPVSVFTYAHQTEDRIAVRVESALIEEERLKIKFSFPYGKECHTCPGYDWESSDKHQSVLISSAADQASIKHQLDTSLYYVHINWNKTGQLKALGAPHTFQLEPSKNEKAIEFTVLFDRDSISHSGNYQTTKENSMRNWKNFWNSGAAIDFSECTDPRAKELERRVILSQYLTRIQSAGSLPPQETGLTMNSWYGKFHLEMHWWHAAHFALWGRDSLLEKSMSWYNTILPKAKATAQVQGYNGARWQKMTDPEGNESPSDIGAFIIWQQPHPIYLAELLYRNHPSKETLLKYKNIVFASAEFMVSFVKPIDGKYHLCHPLIPAQEIFKATETNDPAFELQYWYYGLVTAQQWRSRLGMEEDPNWRKILENLAPLSIHNELYLPNATTPRAYKDDRFRRDHPSVVAAYGFLPINNRIDTTVMNNTFQNIMNRWQWETTWGWDYPMLAMTAARLNKPEQAINALLMNVQKNTYLINGHNYQDKRLRLYLPGNGGLLAAVAMMAGGWDGAGGDAPGFPKNGKWKIKWEGLKSLP